MTDFFSLFWNVLGHRSDLNPGLLPSASGRPITSDFLAPAASAPHWKNGITLLSSQDWKQTMSMISMTSDNDCVISSTGHSIRWLIALYERELKAHQISDLHIRLYTSHLNTPDVIHQDSWIIPWEGQSYTVKESQNKKKNPGSTSEV